MSWSAAARSRRVLDLVAQRCATRARAGTRLLALLPLLYLARGGIVFDFYILLALPFLCLNLARRRWRPVSRRLPRLGAGASDWAAIGIASRLLASAAFRHSTAQRPARWPRGAGLDQAARARREHILSGDDLWTDLREPGSGGPVSPTCKATQRWAATRRSALASFTTTGAPSTTWYSRLASRTFSNRPTTTVALDALHHAHLVQQLGERRRESSCGRSTSPARPRPAMLADSDAYLSSTSIRTAHSAADGTVTSEAQAYALLRAVWSGDRAGFARTWRWTSGNLMNARRAAGLDWRDGAVAGQHSAHRRRHRHRAGAVDGRPASGATPSCRTPGRAWCARIWAHDVAAVEGAPYVGGRQLGDRAERGRLNPSYFCAVRLSHLSGGGSEHDWLASSTAATGSCSTRRSTRSAADARPGCHPIGSDSTARPASSSRC